MKRGVWLYQVHRMQLLALLLLYVVVPALAGEMLFDVVLHVDLPFGGVVWGGIALWNVYWFGLRFAYVAAIDGDILRWRSPLRRGTLPVSAIRRVRPSRLFSNIQVLETRSGRPALVWAVKGFVPFLEEAVTPTSDVPVHIQAQSRISERLPVRSSFRGRVAGLAGVAAASMLLEGCASAPPAAPATPPAPPTAQTTAPAADAVGQTSAPGITGTIANVAEEEQRLVALNAPSATSIAASPDDSTPAPGDSTPTPDATAAPAPTPAPAPTRVALLGDSLFASVGVPPEEGFTAVMSADRPDLEILNDGVSGAQTHDVLANVGTYTEASPAIAVVWIGTNDALAGVDTTVYTDQLNQLIDRLAPAQVILVTPIADLSAPDVYRPYAEIVRQVAQARGLALVDLEGQINPPDFLPDGSHLTPPAIRRVAAMIEALVPG